MAGGAADTVSRAAEPYVLVGDYPAIIGFFFVGGTVFFEAGAHDRRVVSTPLAAKLTAAGDLAVRCDLSLATIVHRLEIYHLLLVAGIVLGTLLMRWWLPVPRCRSPR